ncbi:TspO/MBR related protein [Rhodococcus sp. OK519]|uniref:TspO/MBR family protein n=1 Tax=Rhodococcus sp. OK519 TaxID=2135729 RepID=UPI000D3A5992|nr:TspO/MBR related protein [Rhodococcus sp. OK519]
MTFTTRKPLLASVVAVGAPAAAAAIGAFGSRRAPDVYAQLEKPAWAPPASVFGPVWTGLYTGIGVVGWRMVGAGTPRRTWALHGTQLALNAVWPHTFFGVRSKRLSLAVIAALDVALATEVVDVARRDRVNGAILSAYLGWSLFATALTASVNDPASQHADGTFAASRRGEQ